MKKFSRIFVALGLALMTTGTVFATPTAGNLESWDDAAFLITRVHRPRGDVYFVLRDKQINGKEVTNVNLVVPKLNYIESDIDRRAFEEEFGRNEVEWGETVLNWTADQFELNQEMKITTEDEILAKWVYRIFYASIELNDGEEYYIQKIMYTGCTPFSWEEDIGCLIENTEGLHRQYETRVVTVYYPEYRSPLSLAQEYYDPNQLTTFVDLHYDYYRANIDDPEVVAQMILPGGVKTIEEKATEEARAEEERIEVERRAEEARLAEEARVAEEARKAEEERLKKLTEGKKNAVVAVVNTAKVAEATAETEETTESKIEVRKVEEQTEEVKVPDLMEEKASGVNGGVVAVAAGAVAAAMAGLFIFFGKRKKDEEGEDANA